ncbi:MAG TPA: energy transducer TonB [Kofleriaceae bacterium]|nr:energy transducer TonB [Kofleriaceae bacterium]
MAATRGQRGRAGAAALAVALGLHAAALVGLGLWFEQRALSTDLLGHEARAAEADGAAPALEPAAMPADALAAVELVDDAALGPMLEALPGPADQAGFDHTHPAPRQGADFPGEQAAARGGGDPVGGVPSFTGRQDADQLRQQPWNDPSQNLLPRQRTGEETSSPQSIARRERTGFDERESRAARARDGAERPSAGVPGASGAGGAVALADRAWRDADPRFTSGPSAPSVARRSGSTQPGLARPLVDRGAAATEADRRGATADALDSAAASSERRPMPLELTHPSAGGVAADAGVRGRHAADGWSARGRGDGSAASTHDLAAGDGHPALRARRQDPYFRRLYQRLDELVEYPRELKLRLEQGQVVVTFEVAVADGALSAIRVAKSSGFDEFDQALTRALAAVGPLGPVPKALRGAAPRLRVTAPYAFRSPLIR